MILEKIQQIKNEHPLWGFRRVWAYLRFQEGYPINRKRIYLLMKENKLLVKGREKLKAKRENYPRKIKATRVNEIWGIDMTKIMVQNYGWTYLVIVMDWYSKKIVGYNVESLSKSEQWLNALNMAVINQFPEGIRRYRQLSLINDNGSQPTSVKFMKEVSALGIKQIFASYNNPKGNADTERVMRTIKEDFVWPREWDNIYEFKDGLKNWIENYNTDYPHSSLNYMTPVKYEQVMLMKENIINQEALTSNLFCS